MTRKETADLIEILANAYPYVLNKMDVAAVKEKVDLWEASFGDLPMEPVYKACYFHIKSSSFFPTIAEIRKIIYSKAYLAMETAAAIEQKAIEGERIIKWEDCGCQLCPFLKEGQTEPCEVCVF